jgi:Carboxypeptidase regulatory-like domain
MSSSSAQPASPERPKHWTRWIPVLTLVGVVVGFVARRAWTPPAELVIRPTPAANIPALELPPRNRVLDGRVVDPSGAAVPDALVFLRAGDAPHFAYTDEHGAFHLPALEDAPWDVTVLAIGFRPLAKELADATSPQTIRLDAPAGPAPRLPPLSRKDLAGTLSSRGTFLLEGCEVVLTPTLPPETLSGPLPRRATAAADGRFVFQDLIVGEYTVEVLPAWARGGSWPDLARAIDGEKPTLLTHSAGEAPSVLAVTIQTGEVTGKLVDVDGHPIEGSLVLISPASDPSRVWPPESSVADGSFAVRGLPAGKYVVSIRAGTASVQREALVRAGESTALELEPLEVRRPQ